MFSPAAPQVKCDIWFSNCLLVLWYSKALGCLHLHQNYCHYCLWVRRYTGLNVSPRTLKSYAIGHLNGTGTLVSTEIEWINLRISYRHTHTCTHKPNLCFYLVSNKGNSPTTHCIYDHWGQTLVVPWQEAVPYQWHCGPLSMGMRSLINESSAIAICGSLSVRLRSLINDSNAIARCSLL